MARSRHALLGGLLGVLVTATLAALDAFWPALTVLAGVAVTTVVVFVSGRERKRYLLAGVVYCLALATVLEGGLASVVEEGYRSGVLPGAAGLGAISATLLAGKVAGRELVKGLAAWSGYSDEYLATLWEAIAALGSLLSILWVLLTFAEKVLRYAGISVGSLVLVVLNAMGHRVPVTVAGIEVDAILVLLVGCVLLWFHLLETLHSSKRAIVTAATTDEPTAAETEAGHHAPVDE